MVCGWLEQEQTARPAVAAAGADVSAGGMPPSRFIDTMKFGQIGPRRGLRRGSFA